MTARQLDHAQEAAAVAEADRAATTRMARKLASLPLPKGTGPIDPAAPLPEAPPEPVVVPRPQVSAAESELAAAGRTPWVPGVTVQEARYLAERVVAMGEPRYTFTTAQRHALYRLGFGKLDQNGHDVGFTAPDVAIWRFWP